MRLNGRSVFEICVFQEISDIIHEIGSRSFHMPVTKVIKMLKVYRGAKSVRIIILDFNFHTLYQVCRKTVFYPQCYPKLDV